MEDDQNISSQQNAASIKSKSEEAKDESVANNKLVPVNAEQYKELQKQFAELQTKFDKKQIIYTKINKGLKVISSYLNKKKKLEAEKKKNNKKLLAEGNIDQKQKKRHQHLTSPPVIQKDTLLQSGDYNDYNFSEADYETTTNNDTTPKQSIKDKVSPRSGGSVEHSNIPSLNAKVEGDEDAFNQMKVKFDKPSLQKRHKKKIRSHRRVAPSSSLLNGNEQNNGLFSQNEDPARHSNELLAFLDNEDLTNLKELDELNRLLNGDYVSDNHLHAYQQQQQDSNNSKDVKYCESCGENVISAESEYSSEDEESFSTTSDDMSSDSLDISVSGMSGWSGLSGLSNNKTEDYDGDFEDSENDHEVDSSEMNADGNGTDGITLIKSKKSIQFDAQGEVKNQLKIHQHKIKKKNKQKVSRSKSLDTEDYSMSDSSLPISRITTQNTNNSQVVSGNEEEDDEISKVSESKSSKSVSKLNGKHMSHSSKSRQYDAIKELHRKAINMYKKKLLKKRERLLRKNQKGQEKEKNANQASHSLKPIDEILQSNIVTDSKDSAPSVSQGRLSIPNITVTNSGTHQNNQMLSPNMMYLHPASFQGATQVNMPPYNGFSQPGNIMTPQLNNGGLITPFKDGQMFFTMNQGNGNSNPNFINNAIPSNNPTLSQMNTPMMNLFIQNSNNNSQNNPIIDSPNTNLVAGDSNVIVSPTNSRNHISVFPKFSNVRSPNTMGNNYLKYDAKKQIVVSPNYNFNVMSTIYGDSNENTVSSTGSATNSSQSNIPPANNKSMSNVIQQFASVYIQPENSMKIDSQAPESSAGVSSNNHNQINKTQKIKKTYNKSKVILPPKFESRQVITETNLLDIYDLKLSEKVKTTIDIWIQYHEITSKNYSFERLDLEFGKKWKIKCEPKFIKKYNRRYLLIKSVKMALERDNLDDPYIFLNRLDNILTEQKKPISYFYKKANLPKWLLGDFKKDENENTEDSE